jgi:rhodanese-related sulfurtransferase
MAPGLNLRSTMKAGGARRSPRAVILWGVAALAWAGHSDSAMAETMSVLDQTIASVAKKYPGVTHVPGEDVAKLMAAKSVVIFDVRTPEEYAVSHLDGAILVDPAIDANAFLSQHAANARDKDIVFYCSVGVRSSKLTERVAAGLKAAGARSIGEMKGGIFAWAGDTRPLVDAKGTTDKVHGYDASWGRLVKDPSTLETKPRQ